MNIKKEIFVIVVTFLVLLFLPNIVNAADYVICLDAGHSNNVDFNSDKQWFQEMNPGYTWDDAKYGTSPDYDNPINGIITSSEANLTKETVTYMIEYLKQYDNIKIVVSPRTQGGSYLSQRPKFAKENNADVHITVHYNAGGGTGVETHSIPGDKKSKEFSETISDAVSKASGLYNRGAKETKYAIIKKSSEINCPSIVLEGAFMDNQKDLLFISESANLKKIAAGAVSGILAYLKIDDKGYPDIPDYTGYSGVGQNSSSTSIGALGTVTSNENKFLGLWKNATGIYEQYYNEDGSINDLALYDKDGQSVRYSSTTASVADDIINASEWFFSLLESSERTQNHLTIMKYLMNVYTNSNQFGDVSFEQDIAGLFQSAANYNNMSNIYGGTLQEKVWFALRDMGLSEEATAGVMGNISQESSWNKDDVNSSSGAKGICQWLGGRANGLDKYAASKGVDWTDEDTQIEYLIGELTPGGGANGFATYNVLKVKGCSPDDWKNATTPEDAAVAFRKTFERCGEAEANDARRKSEARRFYDEFRGKTRSDSTNGDLITAADKVARYLEENNYTYKGTDSATYTFPIKDNSQRTLSCSSYIQEVFLQAGYTQFAGKEKIYATSNKQKALQYFTENGVNAELLPNLNNLQPGDILQCGNSSSPHVIMVYSVNGSNVVTKGVPEVLNSYQGFSGKTRTVSQLNSLNYYAIRIKK